MHMEPPIKIRRCGRSLWSQALHYYHAYVITYPGFLSLAKLLWFFRKDMIHTLCITTILRYRLASVTHLGYLKSSRDIPEPKRRNTWRYPPRTFSRRADHEASCPTLSIFSTVRPVFFSSFDSSLHQLQAANPSFLLCVPRPFRLSPNGTSSHPVSSLGNYGRYITARTGD